MVHCRFDYGHANQITDDFFWSMLGKRLPDEEITEYANNFDPTQGYTEEDIEAAIECLTEWRNAQTQANPDTCRKGMMI